MSARVTKQLKNNKGEENIVRMILIAIAFVVGSIAVTIVINALRGGYKEGIVSVIQSVIHN